MKYNVGAQISVRKKHNFAAACSNLSKGVQIFIITLFEVNNTFNIAKF
jgi:hypothetical protein